MPDETTICKFRHMMERHNLGDQLFHLVNQYLQENGLKVSRGTIVDASIINAPNSTKNKKKQRDPEMHQTRKGNQWLFGMKAHIGVDSRTKLVHHVVATAANVHDSVMLTDLLHGEESCVWGDSAYAGKGDVIGECVPGAKDFTNKKGSRYVTLSDEERARNRNKSKVRAKVEHVFLCDEKPVRLHQSPIQGFGQERSSSLRILRPGEPGHGEKGTLATTTAGNAGVVRLMHAFRARKARNTGKTASIEATNQRNRELF